MSRLRGALFYALGRRLAPTPGEQRILPWRRDRGDETLRLDYDLDSSSTVLDIGGFKGQWTSDIYARFCCKVHVFEPHPFFAATITRRFAGNPDIFVHSFGLGSKDVSTPLTMDGDRSSILVQSKQNVLITLRDVAAVISELDLPEQIDLMKINIEGGEYDLLDRLLETGLISRVKNLQVQFHDFVAQAHDRMADIQQRLATTHELTWQYPFIWENWKRKGA